MKTEIESTIFGSNNQQNELGSNNKLNEFAPLSEDEIIIIRRLLCEFELLKQEKQSQRQSELGKNLKMQS
jgi:hypothetical protein